MSIIEFLDVIAARIEHFETGRIIYEEIDNKVQDYLSEFKKKQVIEAKLHLNEVRLELEKDWNTYRDLVKKQDNQGLASTSKTVDEGESSRTKPTIGTLTPKRKVFFKKTTPKSKLLEKLQCSICRKMYESLKALKRHAKKNHNGLGVGDGSKEIENKIT